MFVCKDHSKVTVHWCFNIPMSVSAGPCEVCGEYGPCLDLPGHLITTESNKGTLGELADAAGMSVDEFVHRQG